jgi:hypothetical protein
VTPPDPARWSFRDYILAALTVGAVLALVVALVVACGAVAAP